MSDEKIQWKMPEWMEPFRDKINNTGGNTIERLMNIHDPHLGEKNVILAALCIAVDSQVILLTRLHDEGLLKEKGDWK